MPKMTSLTFGSWKKRKKTEQLIESKERDKPE